MKNKSAWILAFFLLIILFVSNYVNSHIADINAIRADYYFKKNNIKLAQKYYEKAFELGLKDSKRRVIYVNSIINSPLTVEAQEKLVKILNGSKTDIAKINAESFLFELQREIYRKFPENYISNATYNQKIVRWANLPITYSFENKDKAPKYFIQEIENAFIMWEKATDHKIIFDENEKDSNIVIKFDEIEKGNKKGQKYVVAFTTPFISLNSLERMEIVFYTKDFLGKYFTANQVYNIALHEIAHALGFMGHSDNREHIMYLSGDSASKKNNEKLLLTEADINTIKLLYKIKPQITNSTKVKADYIPYLALGSIEKINDEKTKEAILYIKNAPNLPAGYVDLAETYIAEKDYKKAVKCLEKASALADTKEIKAMVYYNLAIAYMYADSLDKAYKKIIESMKIIDSEEKHYLLAEIYTKMEDYENAVKEYSELIKKDPHNIEYIIALTNIYVLNRQFFKARKVLKEYFEKNPKEINNPRLEPYGILKFGL